MGLTEREHTYNCDILTNDSGNVMHPIFAYNFTTNKNICQTRRTDKLSSSIPNDGMCYIANEEGGDDDNQPVLRIYDDDNPGKYLSWSNTATLTMPPFPLAGTAIAAGNAIFGDADESAFVTYLIARDDYKNSSGESSDITTSLLNTIGDDLCLFAPTKDESECHHYYNATTGELCGAAGWNFPFTCSSRARNYHLVDDPTPFISDLREPAVGEKGDQTHCEHVSTCGTRVRNDPNNNYIPDELAPAVGHGGARYFAGQKQVLTCKDLGSTIYDISPDSRNPTPISDKKCRDFYVIDDEGHTRTCKTRSISEGGRFSCDNPPALTDFDDSDTPQDSDGVLWCKSDPNSCDTWLRSTFGPNSVVGTDSSPSQHRHYCDGLMLPFTDYIQSRIATASAGGDDEIMAQQQVLYEEAQEFCPDIDSEDFRQTLADYCEIEYGNKR